MLQDYYINTFDLQERVTVSGSTKPQDVFVGSGFKGYITAITETSDLLGSNNIGKEYILYCDLDVPIVENQVVIADNKYYGVIFVESYPSFYGENAHKEARLIKQRKNK